MSAQVPFSRAFVIKANSFVAVSCEVLAKCVAVGEDEIVVDVGDDDQDGRVVWAVRVYAIVDWERFEVLSQVM